MTRLLLALIMLLPSLLLAFRVSEEGPADSLVAGIDPLPGTSSDISLHQAGQSLEQAAPTKADRDADDIAARRIGGSIQSGLLEAVGEVTGSPGQTSDVSFSAAGADGRGNVAMHFPPWAVNMYNFMLRWSPLAGVMCACAFLCFLATGQKPDHLDYLGVLAHLFMFELLVLAAAGATHCSIADGNGDKMPHAVAKISGMAIFGCGTVVNIWWLAWQTVRKGASKSRPPAEPAEGIHSTSSSRTR